MLVNWHILPAQPEGTISKTVTVFQDSPGAHVCRFLSIRGYAESVKGI